jgi:serine/threonine protein kinase
MFDMLRQLIEPLSKLHKGGFVHGDIKPDNICMRPWSHSVKPQKFEKEKDQQH